MFILVWASERDPTTHVRHRKCRHVTPRNDIKRHHLQRFVLAWLLKETQRHDYIDCNTLLFIRPINPGPS
jgi:hypothetical protein